RLLVALVDITDDVALSTRRRQRVDDLRPSKSSKVAVFDAALELLVQERLVVRGHSEKEGTFDGRADWVEIAHEALIRRWPRLQAWLREEKEAAQRRKVRNARLLAAGLALVLVGVPTLTVYAYNQRHGFQMASQGGLDLARRAEHLAHQLTPPDP